MASMTVINVSRRKPYRDPAAEGWYASLLAHAMVVYAALLLPTQIHFSPPEPFRWEISLVASTGGVSPETALPDKAASVVSSVETPPAVTTRSPSTDTAVPEHHVSGVGESGTSANRGGQAASRSYPSEHGEKLYQVVGPDGSVSYTNVPSDARYHEKHLAAGLLSTVDSTSALKANTTGLSARPDTAGAKRDNAWIWQMILRRMVEESNVSCYRVAAAEGRVVLRLLIDESGYMSNFQVVQSSGNGELDQNTFDILRHINPLTLPRPLGRSSVWLQFPMTYRPDANLAQPNGCARVNG